MGLALDCWYAARKCHGATVALIAIFASTVLFPLNDSRACGNCILVLFHIVSSHSLLLEHGEYLHCSLVVGTHLELSRVSSSWNSLMGSILPDMGSIAPDLRFCRSIVME